MSAVVGIYSRDGRPVDRLDVERMVASLPHRGPDGAASWVQGPVGLGHRMLWTTPESLHERLPLVSSSGDLALTADARLDNREDLIPVLGLRQRRHEDLSDSEIILAAYQKWGRCCPQKLLGDFAFALWDRREQALFCARDHFGIKPFYYYSAGQALAFASEIKALFRVPGVSRRLNELRVADYLTGEYDDTTMTFYQGIFRLPPGHSLTITPDAVQLHGYWSLDPSRELRLGSDNAYADAFRELFTKAVQCRLRSALPVGSHLSGGLDSSAVACTTRKLLAGSDDQPLHTFSLVFDEVKQCDERPFIDAVLAQGGYTPHFVRAEGSDPFGEMGRDLSPDDEPNLVYNNFLTWAVYNTARQHGIRILLDGFDGDSTVSHGYWQMHVLARRLRWISLAREARGFCRTYPGHRSIDVFRNYVRGNCLKPWWSRLERLHTRSPVRIPVGRLARALLGRAGTPPPASGPDWDAVLNPEFVRRVGLEERRRALRQARPARPLTERDQHYKTLTAGFQQVALEALARSTAAYSLEGRYPFWDKRLVEFCLALPPEQKLRRGWSRLIMRRAMAGILPAEIQWRPDKSNLGPNFVHSLLKNGRQPLWKAVIETPEAIAPYLNVDRLRLVYERFVSQAAPTDADAILLWRIGCLAPWLSGAAVMQESAAGRR